MANLIQIKRSLNTGTTPTLANGELAYTANGDILFIGSNGATVAIGGKRVPGTLTANQALVANSTSGIDKVIVANAVVTTITANGALGSAGDYLTSNGTVAYWSTPAPGVTGSNTQIQFNDSGSLGSDANLTFNKTTATLSVGNSTVYTSISPSLVTANTINVTSTTASSNTTTGALKVAGGLGVAGRINVTDVAVGNDSVYATVNNSVIGTNNLFATGTVNGSVLSVGGWVIANQSGIFTSGVVNGDIIRVGAQFAVNTTQVSISQGMKLSANGSLGSANQVLRSDGAGTAYWSDDAGDISAVTAGNGLSGGGSSGDVTLDVGAGNGISVDADSIRVLAGTDGGLVSNSTGVWIVAASGLTTNSTGLHVVANNGIVSNSSGVFAKSANGISIDSSGINVVGGDGLVSNSSGVHVGAANGISVTADTIGVSSGSTLTVNSSGVHVNNDLSITSVTTSGDLTINGNTKLGDASSDVISMVGSVNTNIMPSTNATYRVGNNTMRWLEIHAANVHSTAGYFEGSVQISGDLVVAGNVTTTNVASVVVSDPLIYLAGNNYTSDLVDIGFAGNYNNGSANVHTGLFRDASVDQFYLFKGLTQELSGATTVNTADPTFTVADLNAYLLSGALVSNSSSVTITANSTVNVNITGNSITLSTALAATSGGTGHNTYNSGDLLVANTGNALSKLALGTDGYVLQSNGTAVVYATLDGGTF